MEEKVLNLRAEKSDEEISAAHKIRRDRIKTILIIFLTVLLILTFFSNTIMNKSLPEIVTQKAVSGNLTEKLRAGGVVEANQAYEVTVKDNRTVEKIHVKSGKTVSKGDVLFTLTTGESQELIEAQESLRMLEDEYQKALLSVPTDYASENMQIRNCREDLQSLVNQRNGAVGSATHITNLKQTKQSYKTELDSKTLISTRLMDYIGYVDSADFALIPAEYAGNLNSLQLSVNTAQSAYDAASAHLLQLIEIGAEESLVTAAQTDADTKQVSLTNALNTLYTEKNSVKANLAVQNNSATERIAQLEGAIAAIDEELTGSDTMTPAAIDELIKTAQRELESLLLALESTKKTDNANEQAEAITLRSQKDKIDEQRLLVDGLLTTAETTELLSEYDGVVGEIFVKPKDMTVPDSPLATIVLADEGYTMQVTVEAEKTSKITVGKAAEIVNYWGSTINVVLEDIKNDFQGGSRNRILTFNVDGKVNAGQYLDISIPCGSGRYDVIVPKSAVYEDSDGKFVLQLREKSTPLGNRYFADRVNVEVLAEDETQCAVQGGNLYSGSDVITTSSKPIKPGDQVRIKE